MVHEDSEFQIFSKYFTYHLRMYIETLLWLNENRDNPNTWNTVRNAMIEDNLIHARVLIDFFFNPGKYSTDFYVNEFFKDEVIKYPILEDKFLKIQSTKIGGQLVHLTSKAMPSLKSEQDWPIFEIKEHLVPLISEFLNKIPNNKFNSDSRLKCEMFLSSILPKLPVVSMNAST